MSFSMAAPPPPMPSPPLPTVALAPPPSNITLSERRAQRQRQRATLPSAMPSTLATPASLLFHSSSISSQATASRYVLDPAYTHKLSQEDDTASIMSAASSSLSHRSGTLSPVAVALPRLKSPLPSGYRYPSPAPSLASSVSTATSTSTTSSSTKTSTSSASTSASSNNSVGHRRRKTITAADDPVLVIGRSDSAATVTPALFSPPPTTHSSTSLSKHTSRGRGRSFSRSVRKVASVFNLMKKEDLARAPVSERPTAYRS